MSAELSEVDQCLLQQLARCKFATREQLCHWCDKSHKTTILRHLMKLEDIGLISADAHQEPNIWKIERQGAALMLEKMPSGGRPPSWSVMAHGCHRNAVEILLDTQAESRGFRFLDKQAFWKMGLNPAHGENPGVDASNKAYLVLLDDYGMMPNRIRHTWERRHKPSLSHFEGNRVMQWKQFVNAFIVATTNPIRAEQYEKYVKQFAIPATILKIESIWN